MAEGAVEGGGKGSGRPRGEKFLQFMAAPSPALAPARPQCPLPILLRNAGGHRARCPPSQLGLRLPLTASPSHHAALVPDAKSISGEGCKQNAGFARDGQPVAQTLRGWGVQGMGERQDPRSRCKAGGMSPPWGEGHFPSTGVRGTTVAPVVRVLGLRSTAFFSHTCTCMKLRPPRESANNGEDNHQSKAMASTWQCPFKGTRYK